MQRQKGLDGLLRLARIILEARFAEQHAHMQVGHDQAVKRVIGGIRVFETQQPCPFALVDQRHGAAIDLPAAVFEQIRRAGIAVDTLSLGMSADLEAAVAAGSTMVRIGTAIFGPR